VRPGLRLAPLVILFPKIDLHGRCCTVRVNLNTSEALTADGIPVGLTTERLLNVSSS